MVAWRCLSRLVVTTIAVVLTGCAHQAAPKMSFAEIYPKRSAAPSTSGSKAASVPPLTVVKVAPQAKPTTVVRSQELQAALIAFGARSRANRGTVARGSAMPLAQNENWRELIEALDGFLLRRAEETSSYDVIRARITVEAELELDARRYGELDEALAQTLLDRVNRLGMRMAELRHLQLRPQERRRVAFNWPISPVAVTSLYGRRLHPITLRYRQHAGIDLAADFGQLVTASAPGVVLRAAPTRGYGNLVEVQHADGVITRYGHLSAIVTEAGARVKQGDPLGLAGSTGMSTGVHLHFEIWKNGKPVDPLDELGQPEEGRRPIAAL